MSETTQATDRAPGLRQETLGALSIDVPPYDRRAVTASVVHIGVGGFHRAHQAVYLDEVLRRGELEWGICGVGLLPGDAAVRDAALAQDGLYVLVTARPDGTEEGRVVGSIVDYRFGPGDPEQVLAALTAPTTRIVTLTVTEGGYGVSDVTGRFEPDDELTLADLEGEGAPRSVLGYLTEALRRRRERGLVPFTVVSCDNIRSNGTVARTALTSFARVRDPELADWIDEHVAFPSSMVDRITPVTTEETREAVAETYGVVDRWPVRSESYLQWVLEDHFPAGRPDLAAVGVQLVDDVEPYELMKLHLLNASHQVMSYVGLLAGYTWVHEAARDYAIRALLDAYLRHEAMPTLRPVPGIDLEAYCDQLLERFGSEAVRDTLERQVVDASDRLPKFVLPVLRERLRSGQSAGCCALVLAAWSRYLEAGDVRDARAAELLAAVRRETDEPGALLRYTPVFGDLGADERLVRSYTRLRAELGSRPTLAVVADVAAATLRGEHP